MPLQSIFIALSPDLLEMLTLGLGPALGAALLLIVGGALAGLLGAALCAGAAASSRRRCCPAPSAVLVAGVFQELIQLMLQQWAGIVSDIPRPDLHLGRTERAGRGDRVRRRRGVAETFGAAGAACVDASRPAAISARTRMMLGRHLRWRC